MRCAAADFITDSAFSVYTGLKVQGLLGCLDAGCRLHGVSANSCAWLEQQC